MEMPLNNFSEDVFNSLLHYIDPKEFSVFKNQILNKKQEDSSAAEELNQADKEQLEIEFDPAQERILLDRIITYAEKNLPHSEYINLLLELSPLSISHGKLNLANEILTKAEKETSLKEFRANICLIQSDLYSRKAKWKKSKEAAAKASVLFNDINDLQGVAKCENMLGIIYGEQGEINKALFYFEKGLNHTDSGPSDEANAMMEMNIGLVHCFRGDFDKSLEYFNSALKKLEALDNQTLIAELRQKFGKTYQSQGKFDLALKEFDKCIEIAMDNGLLPILGLSYLDKARVLIEDGKYQLASAFTDKAMEVCHQFDDKLSIADAYLVKGIILRLLKQYDLAEHYLFSSLRINKDMHNELNIAETYYELGLIGHETNKTTQKKAYLNYSLDYYSKINQSEFVEDIKNLLDT